jgi:hypothetical protein
MYPAALYPDCSGFYGAAFAEPNGEVKVSPLPGNLPNKPKEE